MKTIRKKLKWMTVIIIVSSVFVTISCLNESTNTSTDTVDLGLPPGPSSDRHTKWPVGTKYTHQGFWEYLPEGYGNDKDWPLLIFLHGISKRGDGSSIDLDKVLGNGLPMLFNQDAWPVDGSNAGDAFIVLSSQNSREYCHSPNDINSFIRWAIEEHDVDLMRIYLTGLSCGAFAIWDYLETRLNDDLVAAVVPIAGNGIVAWNTHGCDLIAMPIWAFHGENDESVDVSGTNIPMDGLAGCYLSNPEEST